MGRGGRLFSAGRSSVLRQVSPARMTTGSRVSNNGLTFSKALKRDTFLNDKKKTAFDKNLEG